MGYWVYSVLFVLSPIDNGIKSSYAGRGGGRLGAGAMSGIELQEVWGWLGDVTMHGSVAQSIRPTQSKTTQTQILACHGCTGVRSDAGVIGLIMVVTEGIEAISGGCSQCCLDVSATAVKT